MKVDIFNTDNKYSIIYADPPWKYKENWGNGSNEHTYPTMDFDSICQLPVKALAEDEAHLYLWVTNPFLKQGIELCEKWGFEYKTLITWIKTYKNGVPEMGMGYYFRSCTEHIIFGVKGKKKISMHKFCMDIKKYKIYKYIFVMLIAKKIKMMYNNIDINLSFYVIALCSIHSLGEF